MVNKILLEIITITPSITQNNSFAVVLGETRGNRRLPIVIGSSEAQAIAVALENMTPPRPLTHDLIKNLLTTFDISIKEVIISRLLDGIFFSQLVCEREGQEEIVDSRTSDAIALAIRYGCPIYIYSSILDSAGMELMDMEEDTAEELQEREQPEETSVSDFSVYTSKELEVLLNEALDNEDYEKAARVRDELNKRRKE